MTDPTSSLTEQESMDGSPCLVPLVHHVEAVEGGDLAHDRSFGYIRFQCGPIPEVGINGVTLEDVAHVLIDRLEGFQQGAWSCDENQQAIEHFERGIAALTLRTTRRQEQGVEGTMQPHESEAPL